MRTVLPSAQTDRAYLATIIAAGAPRTTALQAQIAALVARRGLAAIDPASFGVFPRAFATETCSISSGSATLTSPDNPWASAEVGQAIHVAGAGAAGGVHKTTIAAIVSPGSITLRDVALTTVAATVISAGGLAAWGWPATVEMPAAAVVDSNGNLLTASRQLFAAAHKANDRSAAVAYLEDFGGATGGADNTDALNKACAWCLANGVTKIVLKSGTYTFNSQPLPIPGLVLSGQSQSQTALRRNYSAAQDSDGFLRWAYAAGNGGGIERCQVYAEDGTSKGIALLFDCEAHLPAGFTFVHDVVVTFYGTGKWYSCLEVNGILNDLHGSQGYRDFRLTGSYLFNGNGNTRCLGLTNAVNFFCMHNWCNGDVLVTGGGTADTNTSVGVLNMVAIGNLTLEQCSKVAVYGSYYNVTFNSSAIECVWQGFQSGTLTNSSSSVAGVAGHSGTDKGFCYLPNGQLLQWFVVTLDVAYANYDFPIAFPTACDHIQGTAKGAGGSVVVFVGSVSSTQVSAAASVAGDAYILAIGH